MTSSLSTPPIGLTDLPNELLTYIFEFFDDGDEFLEASYNLAVSCKRFHDLFLPPYLSCFHISDPEVYSELVFLGTTNFNTLDALLGLQMSFISTIQDLVCRFHVPKGEREVDTVIMHLRRLYFFVSSLESVQNVTLVFAEGDSACGCCLGFRQGETLDWMLEEWSTTMGRTISKILEKGCQSLTISGGKYMVHSYYYKRGHKAKQAVPDGAFTKFKNLVGGTKGKAKEDARSTAAGVLPGQDDLLNVLRGEEWEFDRATGTGNTVVLTKLTDAAKEHSKLQSLTLQSRMMFVPPLLHLLVLILRLPSLESFTISNTSMHKKFWPTVFTLVAEHAGTHLKHLHLSGVRRMLATDLLDFVSAFPRLVSLHLGKDIQHVDHFDLAPFPDFPYLQSLHAPAPWVFKLFDAQRMGLTRLESLEVVYNIRNDGLVHWIRKPKALSLPMLLNLNLAPEARRPLTVSLRVHLGKNPGLKMMEDVKAEIEAEAGLEGAFNMPNVQGPDEMTLVFDEKLDEDSIALDKVLVVWLELFEGLRELEVLTTPPKSISHDEALEIMVEVMQDERLEGLKSVRVNGVRIDFDG